MSCSSYRPISLLNTDIKPLAKVLALRLDSILPSIICPDQTGFVQNRQAFSNVGRLFNIIYNPPSSPISEIVISLDAEKAFDRVEWSYLFEALRRFGFGKNFLSWINLLYSSPLANNNYSDYFPLYRGTRHGCPLSPQLFLIAIEPLAVALRMDKQFMGIFRSGTEHKVSLFADDLLLYTL